MTEEEYKKIIKMTNENTKANDGHSDPEIINVAVQANIARQLTIQNELLKRIADRLDKGLNLSAQIDSPFKEWGDKTDAIDKDGSE